MTNPPKNLIPLIEIASNPSSTVEEFNDALLKVDIALLDRHAFHVIQAIRKITVASDAIKVGAIHKYMGSSSHVFADLVDTFVRGDMDDKEAAKAVAYYINNGWMPKSFKTLIYACAYERIECAKQCLSLGLYRRPIDWLWSYVLRMLNDDEALKMVKVLIDIVNPEKEDLLAIRLAAKQNSPIGIFLDDHLNLSTDASLT